MYFGLGEQIHRTSGDLGHGLIVGDSVKAAVDGDDLILQRPGRKGEIQDENHQASKGDLILHGFTPPFWSSGNGKKGDVGRSMSKPVSFFDVIPAEEEQKKGRAL